MTSPRALARISSALIFGIVLAPAFARASDTETCARAYEKGQVSRADAKLLDAKKELLVCAQDACPAVLRRDCVTWLSQIESEIPAISVRAIGEDGCDRPDAEVTVDGVAVPHAAEGRPIEVNPGKHVIRATIKKGAGPEKTSAEQTTVIGAGERKRAVTIPFGAATTCRAGGANGSAPHTADVTTTKPVPASVYVFGATGIVALGIGTGFAIAGFSQKGSLDDCKGACVQGDVDTMQRTFIVADVAAIVGLVSLAVAGVLYFTR